MPPTTINLNDSTPPAPSGRANVKWQHDVLNPENVSAFMDVATGSAAGAIILAGDFGGTASAPQVISTHLSIPLPVAQGGTGANTFPANAFLAGPVSGAAAPPTVRVLSPLDFQNAVFGASGPSHSSGTVPDPGSVAGTTRYLREDATWQVGIGTPPGGSSNDVQINLSGGFYGDGGFTYIPGSPGTIAVSATTFATGYASAVNSPILALTGSAWTGTAPAPDSFGFQNKLTGSVSQFSTLTLSRLTTNTTFAEFFIDGSINEINIQPTTSFTARMTVSGIQSQSSGFDGATFSLSSAGNASAGLTTYTPTTTFLPAPPLVNMYVTISGFTNAGNNGRFLVQNSSGSTLTVWNSGGIAETHAATSVTDEPYGNGIGTTAAGWKSIDANAPIFGLLGTNRTVNVMGIALPNSVSFAAGMEGNATDAGYLRIVSNEGTVGPTGNHGFEIGSIIDATGANPVMIQMGVFGGFTGIMVPQPLAATSLANSNSFPFVLRSNYFGGSPAASTPDYWSIQSILGTGPSPTSTLTFTHSGAGGTATVSMPPITTSRIANATGASSVNLQNNNVISISGPNTGSINFLEASVGFQGGSGQIQFSMFSTGGNPHGIWMTNAGSRASIFLDTDYGNVYTQSILGQTSVVTQVSVSGGTTTYTGTFSHGAANGLVGYGVTFSGFSNAGNNLNATITSSSNVQLQVATTTQVNEIPPGSPPAASATINISAPALQMAGSYWNGSAFTDDITTIQNVIGAGASPTSVLTISNSGAANWGGVLIQGPLTVSTSSLSAFHSAANITTDVSTRPNLFQTNFTGSVNYTNLRGALNVNIHQQSTGTVALAAALVAETFVDSGAGTVANMKGIEIVSPIVAGGGAITLQEGICVEDQHVTGVTTSYGIHIKTQSAGGIAIKTEGTAPATFGGPVNAQGASQDINKQVATVSPSYTSYTTVVTDYTILVDSTLASFTVTLTSTGIVTGQIFRVKNIGTGTVTVQGAGSPPASIDNASSFSLPTQYAAAEFQWDGSNWWVF